MAALRLGCDLCRITTMEEMLSQDPEAVARLFNAEERDYAMSQGQPAQHLAGVFAAKEALAKAIRRVGLLGKYHREVTVRHREDGGPALGFSETLAEALRRQGVQVLDVSISHEGEYAMAAVLVAVAGEAETSGGEAPERGGASDRREPMQCSRCLLTLDYLSEQRVADVLIKVEGRDGATRYLCPVCLRGW